MIPFFVFLFCLFATYGAYLLLIRKSDTRREELEKRMEETLLYSTRSEDAEVRLSREELMSEIPLLNRLLIRLQIATRIKRTIDQADINLTVMRLMMFSALAGLLAVAALSMITTSLLAIFLSGIVAAALPFVHVIWKRTKRLNLFLEQLPEALDLMSRALSAGHAFAESLHMVASEMSDPVAKEFRRTYEENNLGLSLKLALENLTERIPLVDLRMCVTAILIQRETGGNLAEILEKVAHTIRERFRIIGDLKTLTTSSRLSAWILCAIPVFVAVMATILNPDYMSVIWRDPRGHQLLAVALIMQIVGMLIVRKILRIKI